MEGSTELTHDQLSNAASDTQREFQVERYKYILQQLHMTNENVHRFLAMYQTLATTLTTGGIALFASSKELGLPSSVTRSALIALMALISAVAAFTVLQIIAGVASWVDYRREECRLTDDIVGAGFREPPRWRNFYRWYETYSIVFIVATLALLWSMLFEIILPRVSG